MQVVESTQQTSIRDSILKDRFQMEEVIKNPFGAIATMLKEEALMNEMEVSGTKAAIEKDLQALVQTMDRKQGMNEEEGQLHWAVSIIHTVISQGRTHELYEAINKAFPEY